MFGAWAGTRTVGGVHVYRGLKVWASVCDTVDRRVTEKRLVLRGTPGAEFTAGGCLRRPQTRQTVLQLDTKSPGALSGPELCTLWWGKSSLSNSGDTHLGGFGGGHCCCSDA
jgi:hypothetical protein